jgi:hypothetical protein
LQDKKSYPGGLIQYKRGDILEGANEIRGGVNIGWRFLIYIKQINLGNMKALCLYLVVLSAAYTTKTEIDNFLMFFE